MYADLDYVERILQDYTMRKLSRDEKKAARTLGDNEARYLVDQYYLLQSYRIRAGNAATAMGKLCEPNELVEHFRKQMATLEDAIKVALDAYSAAHPVGAWARGQHGVGPVLAAGLLAHIKIDRAPTAGNIWSFSGLNPNAVWNKGKLRPWNAKLKVVCWKLGESFCKVSGNPKAYYGEVYKRRKALEVQRNEALLFADQAAHSLATRNFGADTVARSWYEKGMLPPARIQLRAQRYAVKLFLAHLHEVWYVEEFGKRPPAPYPIAHLQHAHYLAPPFPDTERVREPAE